MRPLTPIQRVVLVVLDGLRPDAIPRFGLTEIGGALRGGAHTVLARTVTPSVTACAMASLLTGAVPQRHGLQSDRFHIPRPRGRLYPLPRHLAAHGYPSSAFLARMPRLFAGIAHRIAAHVGVTNRQFAGDGCLDIAERALPTVRTQRRGLILLHFPDADRAGHASGWMSDGYADATRHMDEAFGAVARAAELDDPRRS